MSWRDYILADDPNKPKAAPAAAPVASHPLGSAPPMANAIATAPENQFVTALRTAIKGRQSAYTQLLAAADKLVSIIPDANTRLKAAYATTGRNVIEVVQAIDVHISDLESQRMQFTAAMEKTKSEAMGAMQSELTAIEPANATMNSTIQSLAQQITQLQDKINTNSTRKAELTTQITLKTNEFATSEAQFGQALTVVKGELDGQKSIVQSVLS